MVYDIASGLEDPKQVANRYGFGGAQWDALKVWQPFVDQVATQKAELEKNGSTFRNKVRILTEDVFIEAYKDAKNNDATLLQKLEFVKLGAKLGDLEPKASAQVQAAGAGFSININFSSPPPERVINVVDVKPVVKELEAKIEPLPKPKRKKKNLDAASEDVDTD
jgi:hypothetical protein